MSAPLEAVLARLYVDEGFRLHFLENREAALAGTGLTPEENHALAEIDRTGLMLASESFGAKRAEKSRAPHYPWTRTLAWLRSLRR